MNRKGDVSEGIIFVVLLFFLAIAFIVVAFVNGKFHDVIANTALNESDASASILGGLDKITDSGIQNGYIFIMAFLIIGMMLSAFLVRVHPAWFFLYMIFAAFSVFLSVIVANTYSTLANNADLATTMAQQSKVTWAMQHLVQIVIGALAVSILILFAKPPESGGQI